MFYVPSAGTNLEEITDVLRSSFDNRNYARIVMDVPKPRPVSPTGEAVSRGWCDLLRAWAFTTF